MALPYAMECLDWVRPQEDPVQSRNDCYSKIEPSSYIPGSNLPPKKGNEYVLLESSRLLTHVSTASELGIRGSTYTDLNVSKEFIFWTTSCRMRK